MTTVLFQSIIFFVSVILSTNTFVWSVSAASSSPPGIYYQQEYQQFVLQGVSSSYVFRIDQDKNLEHLHWGAKVNEKDDLSYLSMDSVPVPLDPGNKNAKMLEWDDFGTGDFRSPSFRIEYENGYTVSPVQYKSHQIMKGKPQIDPKQPAIYTESESEASTLVVVMEDPLTKLQVELYYTIYHQYDILTRRAKIINSSTQKVKVLSAHSFTIDFPSQKEYFLSSLTGAWARERFLTSRHVDIGFTNVETKRGVSSHQSNPFGVLSVGGPLHETEGEHFAFNLVYSGNFLLEVERVQTGRVRVNMGINPFAFEWNLSPQNKESFVTPECVLAYSNEGVGPISTQLHELYRSRLVRGQWRDKRRPILVNSWEAMYFGVSSQKILDMLAFPSVQMGIEMVVLDDGWFGQRDNDSCCLGDWTVNKEKLPTGLKGLGKDLNDLGLQFGIWMEPEMISVNSDLYRQHPEWALHVPGRPLTEGRNQLLLDVTRQDVREFMVKSVSDVLSSANITYLKWDFNRHLTEVASEDLGPDRQGEVYHRFILGVYEVMDRLVTAFPNVLFESCSSGGGRFDPAMLYYMPQVWTSDNTDAISRVKIQYGTSLAYPSAVMGAHVSAVPNHQVYRTSSMRTRTLVAYGGGSFGYELDLSKLSAYEREEVRYYVDLHAAVDPIVRKGKMHRILSPFSKADDGAEVGAWMFVSPDQQDAIVFAFNTDMYQVVWNVPRLKLQGLDPNASYYSSQPGMTNRQYTGNSLMAAGLVIQLLYGAQSFMIALSTDKGTLQSLIKEGKIRNT